MLNAAPDVVAIIGPDTYHPDEPTYSPISGAQFNTPSSSGSTSTSSSGGTSGGSSSTGSAGGGGVGSGTVATAPLSSALRSKYLVLRGTPAELDSAFKLLAEVDVPPRQVMIEVKVIDTSPEDAEQIGLAYTYSPLGLFGVPGGTPVTGSGSTFTGTATTSKPFGYFSSLPLGVGATLNALNSHSESKILANPQVQVLDNDSASIFIGDTVNVQLSQTGINGNTLSVQQFPVGIILLVRPRVNADGKITMLVHPVVSTVTATVNGLPQTSSREAETTVMVQDGETIVIGGLIKDEMSKEVDSIPFLSKLPIIGELFKNRTRDHQHTEVMVFITPHLLKQ